MTWGNRPALSGAAFGSVVASASATLYSAPLDVSALQGLPGTTRTVAVTSGGTDSLWLWSRNHSNSSYRPVLVLTYS